MSEVGHLSGTSPSTVDAAAKDPRPYQGQRAGIVTRTAANAVDFAVIGAVLMGGYVTWAAVRFLIDPPGFSPPAPPFLAILTCGAVLLFGYFTVAWATTGRTYGDHLLGLRVVNWRGQRMRWSGAVVRAAFSTAFPIGLYWAVVSPTRRSIQDTVLRTQVLYDWPLKKVALTHPSAVPGASPVLPEPRSSEEHPQEDQPQS